MYLLVHFVFPGTDHALEIQSFLKLTHCKSNVIHIVMDMLGF